MSRFESKMGYLLTCVIVLTSGCVLLQPLKFQCNAGIFILAIPPPGGGVLAQLKNREEFGGLKRKGKGEKRRKKEKSDKIHVKIPL